MLKAIIEYYRTFLILGILSLTLIRDPELFEPGRYRESLVRLGAFSFSGIHAASSVSVFGPGVFAVRNRLQELAPEGSVISFATDDQDTFRIQNLQYDLAPYVVAFDPKDRYVVGFFDVEAKATAFARQGYQTVYDSYPFYIFKAIAPE